MTNIAYDRNARSSLSQALREDEYDYPVGFEAGYGDGKFKVASGFVQGNRFLILLQDWTSRVPGNASFDRLPIPFRAVATDLANGDEVLLARGSLAHAIRASMAAPSQAVRFVFSRSTTTAWSPHPMQRNVWMLHRYGRTVRVVFS